MSDSTLALAMFVGAALGSLGLLFLVARKARYLRDSEDRPNVQKGTVEALPMEESVQPASLEETHGPASVPPSLSASVPERKASSPTSASIADAKAAPPAPVSDKVEIPQVSRASEQPKSIFISYRRQDSQHITGRIYDRLSSQFGKEAVFKDVDSIPLGYDFRDHLREQVGRCAVLVAVIGKNWNPPAASGDRRLSDPRDHLRIEIESALERHIPVIPVLVDGIEMPAEDELPVTLGRLAYHNGIAIRPDPDFHHDADRLARGIEMLFKQAAR